MIAISTVAMTAYNCIALRGRVRTAAELLEDIQARQHPELTEAALDAALEALLARNWIQHGESGYMLFDHRRRVVVSRDLSDAEEIPETGELRGGWTGWKVRDPQLGALIPLTEVLP